jgi:hypothetical protein
MMKKRDEANGPGQDRSEKEGRPEPSKQARLEALLFKGTLLGTTLLTVAASLGFTKYPLDGGE